MTDFEWSLSVYSTWDIYVWHCNEQRQWRHFSKSSLISQPSSTVPPALEALCIVTYEGAAALVPWLAAAARVALGARHCGGMHGAHGSRRGTALKGGNGELRGKRPLYNHSNTRTLKLASLGVITLFVVGPQLFEVVSYTLLLQS